MPRPRRFDADAAVERAKDVFWRRGFHATSVADLAGELRLGPGSLYAAFDSKEGLYQRAFERYCTDQVDQLVAALEEGLDIRTAVRQLLLGLMEADLDDPRGCFLVNSITERHDHPATMRRVASTLQRVESALAGALERAKARGELSPERDPIEISRFLLTFIQGLRIVGQARLGREFAEDAIDGALSTLA